MGSGLVEMYEFSGCHDLRVFLVTVLPEIKA